MKRPEQKLLNFLKDHHLTIAFAESMTCGMAAMRIGNVSGTSEVFAGSIVCYDTSVKTGLLKIAVRTIKKYTAESQQVTDNLAKHLTKK
jgi:nicotinamide-nucleotide amidase